MVTWKFASIAPVWVLVLIGSLFVAALAAAEYLTWLPVVLAAAVLLTFCIQLALRQKEGFVSRLLLSVSGALVIVAAATGVLWAMGA
jgi:hypothetical protein